MHAFLTPKQIVGGVVVAFLLGVAAPATAIDAPTVTAPRAGITSEAQGFADTTSMTPAARRLYLDARPTIEDATGLAAACQRQLEPGRYLLGCVDRHGQIHLLRIGRPDLSAKMPVTAAHEMLHLAYGRQAPRGRARLVRAMKEFYDTSPDPQLHAELDGYPETERYSELHSRLGTEVAVLPRVLERHYAQFFDDRAAVVGAWSATEQVLDGFETRVADVRAQFESENTEAERLSAAIGGLRDQGRLDESNLLVADQNAAVDRARSLSDQLHGLVDEYNSIVASLTTPGATTSA